ncbi:MAG: cache domain-containing protein [Phycicoccus sp.]
MTGPARGRAGAGARASSGRQPPPDVAPVVARVDELGRWVAATVDSLAGLVSASLAGASPRRSALRIDDECRELLAQREIPLAGAGYVAAPGVLVDARYWLEWWVADPAVGAASCRRLLADTDPMSVGFRDYTELPWFVAPRDSGRLEVTGPYVDYVCTDQHTLTITRPVRRGVEFAGVVGVDLLAATVESLLAPQLDAVGQSCVVVNRVGRVVASSDPSWVTGDLIRGLPYDAWFDSDAAAPEPAPVRGWRCASGGLLALGVLHRD